MTVSRKPMDRRTLLRGVGAALSLPLLEAMTPTAKAAEAVAKAKRLQVFYMPNGMIMESFTPATTGRGYELSKTLTPLAAHRERFSVISGLSADPKRGDGHAAGCAGFLTGASIRNTDGYDVLCDTSIDQIAAQRFGQETTLASMELGLEPPSMTGTCVVSYSCAYTNSLSWRNSTTPMPVTYNPRDVFERLFGDGDTIDPKSRLAQLKREASILDFVMEDSKRVSSDLGREDRRKLDQYMDAVRDVEMRIQKARTGDGGAVKTDFTRPAGVPETFQEHARLMIDLQVLAMQADLTRVSSFMTGRELSNRAYLNLDVPEAHHMLSHHQNLPEKMGKIQRINQHHMEQFAYYLDRMSQTKEGDGSLLDNTLVLAGSAFGDPNIHDPLKLPTIVAGGLAKGGEHIQAKQGMTRSNVLLAVLHKLDIDRPAIGDSNSAFTEAVA
jgi:Protein of unknown function (DUF1552)